MQTKKSNYFVVTRCTMSCLYWFKIIRFYDQVVNQCCLLLMLLHITTCSSGRFDLAMIPFINEAKITTNGQKFSSKEPFFIVYFILSCFLLSLFDFDEPPIFLWRLQDKFGG